MKKSNVIKEISEQVDAILAKANADIKAEEKIIADLDANIAGCEKEKADAVKVGDNTKYKEAVSKLEDLSFQKKYHEERVKTFSSAPLIDESTYNSMVADLLLYIREASDALTLETVNFLLSKRDQAVMLDADINSVNDLLRKLQRKVYREDIYKKNPDGTLYLAPIDHKPRIDDKKVKKFNDHEYLYWIYDLTYLPTKEAGSRIMTMRGKVQGK